MNITIYTKKIRKQFIIDANKEYLKRLNRYCKIKIITTTNFNKELNKVDDKTYTININTKNITNTSYEMAKYIEELAINSNSKIHIFINADCDFKFNKNITISKMDIDIELLSTLLLEQIYRSFKINNNEPYHK